MGAPKVFPVIASRGRQKELAEQLRRLSKQLTRGEQVIVVLDGENPSAELIEGHLDWLTLIPLAENRGVDRARKVGNSFVDPDGVVLEIDDHDWAEPELLAEVRAAFADPGVMLAYCDAYVTDPEHTLKRVRVKADGTFRENGMLGLGMRAYRKWIYDAVGGYPVDFFPANDLALMCKMERLLGDRGIAHIRKPLVTVVIDSTGISATHKDAQADAAARACDAGAKESFPMPFRLVWPPKADEFIPPSRTVEPEDPAVTKLRAELKAKPPVFVKPHVLLVGEIAGWGRGGGEMSLLELLKRLTVRGWQATCLYARPAGDKEPEADWIRFMRLRCDDPHEHGRGGLPNMATCERAVEETVRMLNPGILLTEARSAPNVIRVGRELGVPVVVLIQFWHSVMKPVEEAWDALHKSPVSREWVDHEGLALLAKADAVVANSEFVADKLADVMGRAPEAVVYPPVDAEQAVVKEAKPVHEREFVMCPSVQRLKGTFIFLELARRNPNIKFLLLAGDQRHAREHDVVAKAQGLSNVTIHREWVLDMRTIYAQTRLTFLGTQTCETFSRVSAESMANGIPLLVSDAGNLARIVDGEHGIIVPRKGAVTQWNEALHKALALRPTPDARWCQDHSDRFAEVLNAHRQIREAAFLQCAASGVHAAIEQMRQVLGISTLDSVDAEELKRHGVVVVSGQYTPELDAACPTRLAWWWHSHMAQMDSNRHEVADLLRCLEAVGKSAERFLLFTARPEAELFGPRYGGRVKWLPNVRKLADQPQGTDKLKGRHVFIPGPYMARKNCYAALSAVALAEAEAHVTARVEGQAPSLAGLARAIGVKLHVHKCETGEDVTRLASGCQAAIMPSLAETFCHAAAECIEVGTPVVSWAGVPAAGQHYRSRVADPTNVAELADTLKAALAEPSGLLAEQWAGLKALVETHKAAARKTLMEIAHAS